jgi:hypothetical protein
MCPISPRSARQQFATIELLRRMAVVCDRIDLHSRIGFHSSDFLEASLQAPLGSVMLNQLPELSFMIASTP